MFTLPSSKQDLLAGALSVTLVVFVHKIWQAFQFPSVDELEAHSKKPIQHGGDDNKVTVWGFDKEGEVTNWKDGISDDSPFVSRVENFLRFYKIPFEKAETKGLMENPRSKVPFANVKGTMIDDSSRIIDSIRESHNLKVDAGLTEEQKVTGYLIQQLLFNSLYWVLLHGKFCTTPGRKHFVEYMTPRLPPVISSLIFPMIFRKQAANLAGSGWGLLPRAEIVQKGASDVRVLSKLLGKQDFLFGDKPTSYDVDVYTWLVLTFYEKLNTEEPWVFAVKKECPNLIAYVARMKKILYPELEK